MTRKSPSLPFYGNQHKSITAILKSPFCGNAKIDEILEFLEGYTPDEVRKELETYDAGEVLRIWDLMGPTFRAMCWKFGKLSPSRRAKAPELHQQIKRLGVLQEVALIQLKQILRRVRT